MSHPSSGCISRAKVEAVGIQWMVLGMAPIVDGAAIAPQ
jgi:hypothetical protein